MTPVHDVVVIGAGPAGATAARLLAGGGWDVAVVEKTAFPRRKVCGEFISGPTQPLLSGAPIAEVCRRFGGPDVKRVAFFGKHIAADAPMPFDAGHGWGRAIAREHLEVALVQAAADCGAQIWQPWKLVALTQEAGLHIATISDGTNVRELLARLVIAATGSWERNPLSDLQASPHEPSDLLAFKARFRGAGLAADLMPLLTFPGGYGGMVRTNGDNVSLSFCIRRDVLQHCRDAQPGSGSAAETAFRHILASSAPARNVLRDAEPDGHWLAAGPIRPGMRVCYANGIFFAGNLAGEAHPVVAEGISMAMQSAWLLHRVLVQNKDALLTGKSALEAGRIYTQSWRRAFAGRVRAAAFFARIAMNPGTDIAARVMTRFPGVLTFCAGLSGKSVRLAG